MNTNESETSVEAADKGSSLVDTVPESTVSSSPNKSIDEKIRSLRSDLEDLREKRKVERYQWTEKEDSFHRGLQKLHTHWVKRKARVNIQLYAKVMEKEFGNRHLIPQKILTQQAHLCRSLHQMEVHSVALKLVDDQNKEIVKLMKRQISSIQEEESNIEVELMNKLCKLDAIVKTMQSVLGIVPDPKDDWQVVLSQANTRKSFMSTPPPLPTATTSGMMHAFNRLWSLGRSAPPVPTTKSCDILVEPEQPPGEPTTPLVSKDVDEVNKEGKVTFHRAQSMAFIIQE